MNSHFGISNLPIVIYHSECSYTQSDLFECELNQFPYAYPQCNSYREAGVKCECELMLPQKLDFNNLIALCTDGEVELYSAISTLHGNIHVCINGTWSKVCGQGNSVVDNNLASVVCTEIGYSPYGKYTCFGNCNYCMYVL